MEEITPELLLNAYASGYFPMAKTRSSKEIYWFYPDKRGIIPLDNFHIPASLKKFLKKDPFTTTVNQCFRDVMLACADRDTNTWINDKIIDLYTTLHRMGFAHSVEVWENETLVGGVYGVCIGSAFFGESMFSHTSNASKAALVHLVELLNKGGYSLLDAQYVNDHLKQFGIIEITREDYLKKLEIALATPPRLAVF